MSDSDEAGSSGPGDFVHAPSTAVTFAALTVEALLAAVLVAVCFHGFRRGPRRRFEDGSRSEARLLSPNTGPTNYSLESVPLPRAPAGPHSDDRMHEESTNNMYWALYFCAAAVYSAAMVFSDVIGATLPDTWSRLSVVISRLAVGLASVALTVAVNHHRVWRHRDFVDFDASLEQVQKQVTRMNWFTVAVFFLDVVADFVASHIVVRDSVAETVFFYLYCVAVVVVNVPPLFAGVWILIHAAESRPVLSSRVVLLAALALRLLSVLPPALWNEHILSGWTSASPCPIGGVASFYDVLAGAATLVSNAGMLWFVVVEYRRASLTRFILLNAELTRRYDQFDSLTVTSLHRTASNISFESGIQ